MDDKFFEFENKINKKALELYNFSDIEVYQIKEIIKNILDIYTIEKITDDNEICEIKNQLNNQKISILLFFSIYLLFEGEIIEDYNFRYSFGNLLTKNSSNNDIIQIITYYLEFLKSGLKKLLEKVNSISSVRL